MWIPRKAAMQAVLVEPSGHCADSRSVPIAKSSQRQYFLTKFDDLPPPKIICESHKPAAAWFPDGSCTFHSRMIAPPAARSLQSFAIADERMATYQVLVS